METDSNKAAGSADAFKPHNKSQLAELLGVSVHILNRWIEAVGEKLGPLRCKVFSSKQVQLMVDTYGRAPVNNPHKK
jgi:hypothetical protein